MVGHETKKRQTMELKVKRKRNIQHAESFKKVKGIIWKYKEQISKL